MQWTWHLAKKLIVAVVGTTVLLVGVVMVVLPGPGLPVVAVGLAILGTEFLWARMLFNRLKEKTKQAVGTAMAPKASPAKPTTAHGEGGSP